MARSKVDYSQTSKKTWKQFCRENPEMDIDYLTFQNIIYTFNYGFRDYLMETGHKGKLPWGIGDFAVTKRKPLKEKYLPNGEKFIALPINWKKTKELGKYVYHLNMHTGGYKFRIKWFIDSARFRMSEIWSFKPSRITSRLLKHYISQGNQERYFNWDILKNVT